uniref:60S ribosomal export protein NMD3-like n=1 Tax=Rhizophora mucronata TaxID=61149 RepID=A0A2P2J207_RHIMU
MSTSYWSNFTQKINKFHAMTTICKEKINTMIHLLDFCSTGSSTMLQNQLFQVKESSPVRNMLPELHSSDPLIRIGLNP